MTASSPKAIVLPKKVTKLDPTSTRYPSLNYPRSRIELASVLAIVNLFWRKRCIGNRKEMSENESLWSASVQSHAQRFAFESFFYTLVALDYFFFYFNLIIYPPAMLPCSQNRKKARREWQVWLEGKLMMLQGRRWGSFQKLTFSLLPALVQRV